MRAWRDVAFSHALSWGALFGLGPCKYTESSSTHQGWLFHWHRIPSDQKMLAETPGAFNGRFDPSIRHPEDVWGSQNLAV